MSFESKFTIFDNKVKEIMDKKDSLIKKYNKKDIKKINLMMKCKN